MQANIPRTFAGGRTSGHVWRETKVPGGGSWQWLPTNLCGARILYNWTVNGQESLRVSSFGYS